MPLYSGILFDGSLGPSFILPQRGALDQFLLKWRWQQGPAISGPRVWILRAGLVATSGQTHLQIGVRPSKPDLDQEIGNVGAWSAFRVRDLEHPNGAGK